MTCVRVRLPAACACVVLAGALAVRHGVPVRAQGWVVESTDAENEAIRYSRSVPDDAVARLQHRLDAGATHLRFDQPQGYLRSVLAALGIPEASQVLVFSRTSFQRALISPERPRAVYFGPDVHVGWVPGSDVIEVAAADPRLGAVFYTLKQASSAAPRFERQSRACLSCHDSSRTGGVPGFLMRSVPVGADGTPIEQAESFVTTDASPMRERWGGWYVTGGLSAGHMGLPVPRGPASNAYLRQGSDAAALLMLGHQTHVHNLITRLGYRTRMALAFDAARGRAGSPPAETLTAIAQEAEPLVRALLFADEIPPGETLGPARELAAAFERGGPRTSAGHSLYQLDLRRRLSRFPCSYLVYSTAFEGLPGEARAQVYRRMWAVLTGQDGDGFERLSSQDRRDVLAILLETRPEFRAHTAAARSEE